MPSNDESTTACGVSSMMKSTPVRCSSARMFRPSRPMMRPFMSSLASSTTVTVVSAVWLAATRWSASATSARARRRASPRASSSIWRTERASSCRTRSCERSSIADFASSASCPEMRSSSRWRSSLRCLQLLLELLQMHLAVADALLAPRRPRSSFWSTSASRCAIRSSTFAISSCRSLHLALDLGAELDGALARLDLRLAPDRLGLALGVRDEPPALVLAAPHRGAARRAQPDRP